RLTDIVDMLFNEKFASFAREGLINLGAADWAVGLVCDGVIGGLGSILSFFPQITLLFLFLSILEDSGYMARAAFIMDRALHAIGLSGKSFVPMLMGFGCSVPALMATRTLENEKDRRMTIMLVPFMSCSAKMPVYAVFISALFASYSGITVFSIYALGLIVAIIYAFIMQKTILKGGHTPFVMELPPYRLPTAKTLGLHLWEKLRDFFTKAGTVLLGASIVVWALQYFSFSFRHVTNPDESMLAVIGKAIAPIFAPLGFGEWQSSVSVLSGLIARESIVSTLGILYGSGEGGVSAVISQVFTPAQAYSFMSFTLLFIPCVAAVSSIRREMNSRKWTAITLGCQALTAWIVTFIVYHIALLFA
ncbi:MAG: ferrous iron transport protein B, partial [Oscillospiraceae bacterium]|nr:ferrous iron transport protein B [Oscillospiraceae bacterium]